MLGTTSSATEEGDDEERAAAGAIIGALSAVTEPHQLPLPAEPSLPESAASPARDVAAPPETPMMRPVDVERAAAAGEAAAAALADLAEDADSGRL